MTVFKPHDGPVLPLPLPAAAAARARTVAAPRAACSACCPGIIGSLQANEALKLLLGDRRAARRPAAALRRARHDVRRGRAPARPRLPGLRRDPTITEYIDYVEFCAGAARCTSMTHGPHPARRSAPRSAARAGRGRRARPCASVLDDLVDGFPALGAQIFDDGEIAPFVNVYLDGEDVRTLDGLDTPVAPARRVILLPAMAGGATPRAPLPVVRRCSSSSARRRSSSCRGSRPSRACRSTRSSRGRTRPARSRTASRRR